ncbi:MAG: phage major tail tube protein [Salinisphaeraceae bacterium]
MIRDVMRDAVAFVDGRNYAGQCNQVTLPELTISTEEMRAGGMDAPLEMDMGMEALRASIQFQTVPAEVLKLFGQREVPLTIRGALLSHDGSVKGATAELRGRFVVNNPGDWQPGQTSNLTTTMACTYYKLAIDGETVHEIDVQRMVRIVNGTDMLEQIRGALGI